MKTRTFTPPKDISLGFMYLAPTAARVKLEFYQKTIAVPANIYRGFLDLAEFAKSTDEPLKSILTSI